MTEIEKIEALVRYRLEQASEAVAAAEVNLTSDLLPRRPELQLRQDAAGSEEPAYVRRGVDRNFSSGKARRL